MQISRRILLACVATAILLPGFLNAETETQKKAREALAQKMQELSGQPETSTPAVTPVPQVKPQAVEKTVAPAVVPPPAAPAATTSNADVEKARQALRDRMKQLDSQSAAAPVAAPVATPVVPAEKAAAPVAVAVTPEPAAVAEPSFGPVPDASNPGAEKALQALRDQMKRAEPAAQPETPQQVKAPAKKQSADVLEPLVGPPTGLSAAKEEKLKLLLADYRADKLTPQQYHAERAKILAEP